MLSPDTSVPEIDVGVDVPVLYTSPSLYNVQDTVTVELPPFAATCVVVIVEEVVYTAPA